MPRIELKDVSKTYPLQLVETARALRDVVLGRHYSAVSANRKVAVDNVTLHIDAGERVGIIGRNGAGKSTLLHMIAGVSERTSGTVTVDGKVTSILTLGIGLREELTGRENIYLDGEIQGKTRAEVEKVLEEIVAFAELGEFIERPIRTYSTGMKARLAFAMISHIDPEILLIDEALSVGDASFSTKATKRIREICERGRIVVVVSHSLASITEICNRCLWMEDGRIAMDGRAEEVTAAYARSVRDKDDHELLERFKGHIGSDTFLAGNRIQQLAVYQNERTLSRSAVQAEQGFTVHVEATLGPTQDDVIVRLTVERLDGLFLVDDSLRCDAGKGLRDDGSLVVEAVFPPAIASGIYKLTVGLSIGGSLVAQRSSIFEVVAYDQPTGGRATLHYPYTIESRAVTS